MVNKARGKRPFKTAATAPKAKVAATVATPPVAAAVSKTVQAAAPVAAKPIVEVASEPVVEPAPVVKKIVQTAEVLADSVAATVKGIVPAVTRIIEDAAPKMAETASKGTDTMETTIEKTQAMFADLNDRAKAQVEKNTKLVAEATDFAKGNVEALVESGKIAAKGLEILGQDAAEYSRKSFESATATLKSFSSVKSPADFFKLQSDFVRQSFDAVVAETSKNTEAFIKLAGDAAQPISSRFAVAVEKVKTAA